MYQDINLEKMHKINIARIAKAALHKLPGKSSLNVNFVCLVCPVCLKNGDLIHHNRPHSGQKSRSLVHLVIEILDPLGQGFSQLIPKNL